MKNVYSKFFTQILVRETSFYVGTQLQSCDNVVDASRHRLQLNIGRLFNLHIRCSNAFERFYDWWCNQFQLHRDLQKNQQIIKKHVIQKFKTKYISEKIIISTYQFDIVFKFTEICAIITLEILQARSDFLKVRAALVYQSVSFLHQKIHFFFDQFVFLEFVLHTNCI